MILPIILCSLVQSNEKKPKYSFNFLEDAILFRGLFNMQSFVVKGSFSSGLILGWML